MDSNPLIRNEGPLQPVPHSHTVFPVREITWRNSTGVGSQDSLTREYMRVLVKRRWVVLITVAAIFGAAAVATLRTTKVYEAVGSVAINKDDPMPITFKDSENLEDSYTDSADMETEVRVLRSDLLALQVIRQLNLDKPPESLSKKPGLPLTTDALDPDSPFTSAALATFKSNLGVTLVPNTRVIEITYRSPDKNLAARVVNTLASTYVEQNFKTRFESTMQASEWLSKQLVDLQMKVESSQEKLVKYEKEHDILGVDEKQNLTTTKLDELNRDLTAAESARMEKESLYRMAEAGGPDAVNAINSGQPQRGSGDQSTLLDRLREQQAQLKIQQAQLSTQFGPSYPKVAQINSQLKALDVEIQAETKKIVGGLRGDYLAALQRENLLHGALDQQKQQANKLNESAIEYNLLKRDLDTNRTLYESLLQKLKEAGITASLKSNNFRIIDPARIPGAPVEPNIPRNFSLALALGLSTGIGLAFLIDGLDSSVRTPEQAQAISGLPSLGMIPLGSRVMTEFEKTPRLAGSSKEAVELVTQARPQSRMAEAYRALRTSLLLTSAGTPPKTILVTSALPQEGKTTTSINCAVVLAQKGSRVLLIDADLRRPGVHKTLGMGPCTGLSNLLTGSATLQQAVVRSNILPSLFILPAGTPPPNPAELLASSNMNDLLAEMRADYDHIVIDTPPTLSVTDAVIMATRADTVVLVIRSGQTTRQALQRSRDLLAQVNARMAGVLLNAADLDSADYRYHYEYQGKYGDRYYQEGPVDTSAEPASKATVRGL
jgi:succinoglycan biosynthesis transport protein ExoP